MRIKLHFKYFVVLIPLTAVLIFTYFNAQVQPCITRSIAFAPSCLELFHENSLVDTTNAFAVDRLMFLNGNFKPPNGTPVVSYQAPDRSYFSVVDMARVSKASVFAKAAIRYLAKKNRDLVRRVPKFRDDPDAMAKLERTDEMINQRSIMVLNTERPIEEVLPEENDFLGGARVVTSDSSELALPFQLVPKPDVNNPESPADAWLRSFRRTDQISAEIGALNAKTDANPWRSTELINLSIQLTRNLNVQKVYIHTGIFQAALYEKMHLQPEIVYTFDRKNIIIRYDTAQTWVANHMNIVGPAFNPGAHAGVKPNHGPRPN